jgi:hypothetical protein
MTVARTAAGFMHACRKDTGAGLRITDGEDLRHDAALIRKICSLPLEKLAEVEDFVDFLNQREDRQLTQAAAKLAEKAFRTAWNNPADAAYDRL